MNAARKDRSGIAQLRRGRGEGGFTLMEVMVAVGIMSVALALGAVAFAEVLRLRTAQGRYQERLAAADFLLRRFERDVRAGSAFSPAAGGFVAGAQTAIVSTAGGAVVYRAAAGKVERIELGGDGTKKRDVLIHSPGLKVSFDLEGAPAASARSAVATVEWIEPPAIGVSRPTLSLRVALRNSKGTANQP